MTLTNPRKILYISGPYSDADPVHGIPRNVLLASEAALTAWKEGWVAFCPHKNCAGFEHANLPYETWIAGDLAFLRHADAICMVGEWPKSEGARREYRFARDLNLPVYCYDSTSGIQRVHANHLSTFDFFAKPRTGAV